MHDGPARFRGGGGEGAGRFEPDPVDHHIRLRRPVGRGIEKAQPFDPLNGQAPGRAGLRQPHFLCAIGQQRQRRAKPDGAAADGKACRLLQRFRLRLPRQTHRVPAAGQWFGERGGLKRHARRHLNQIAHGHGEPFGERPLARRHGDDLA